MPISLSDQLPPVRTPVRALRDRQVRQAMTRGFMGHCPNCGRGKLLRNYLKVVDNCSVCGEDFSHQRADDAPPYFTILIVGHLIVPLMFFIEIEYSPSLLLSMIGWPALTALCCVALLPRIKGAVVGMQWAMRMHGFGGPTID
ncbi:MAG: DUF983 domain-containing protein [Parvibaculaceae bacterium]|nr:DUF983 domain-containing protein [Parvibaculaceae bacterium]